MNNELNEINIKIPEIFNELFNATNLKHKQIVVLGCSSSEILGKSIGKGGSYEIGAYVAEAALSVALRFGLFLAVQCCEHLNRALVVSAECAEIYGLEPVSVRPVHNAGGSCASAAYNLIDGAVVVEHILAHAGLDIGDTNIGMHVKFVQVPFRPSIKQIGEARVTALYHRPKLIGGLRAEY